MLSKASFWVVFERVLHSALGIHLTLCMLFFSLGVSVLAWFNVASIFTYVGCLALVRGRYRRYTMSLTWLEVFLHTLLATLLLGWSSGFHYYFLILAAVIFLADMPTRRAGLYVLGIAAIYIGLNALTPAPDQATALSERAMLVIRSANMLLTITMIAGISMIYRASVERAVEQLEDMAATDPLTGLANRREFLRLAAENTRRRAADDNACLILGDIDNFKQINDRYGHDIGDRVLVAVSEQLHSTMRDSDVLARWGGEEFIVLLPATDVDTAAAVAERARAAIATLALACNGETIPIGMTFGLYPCGGADNLDACITRADDALRRGKRRGKNQVACARRGDTAPPEATSNRSAAFAGAG